MGGVDGDVGESGEVWMVMYIGESGEVWMVM